MNDISSSSSNSRSIGSNNDSFSNQQPTDTNSSKADSSLFSQIESVLESLLSGGTTEQSLLSQSSIADTVTVASTRAVESTQTTYTVRAGDNLTNIAQRHGVSVADLATANGISDPNKIFVGDTLTIPTQSTATPAQTYTIQRGDTLGAIATRFGVNVDTLASSNGIANPNRIYPGDTITIPAGGTPSTPPAQSYTIQRGDTLGSIATRFGVDVNTLASSNGIANPNRIYPGDTITIPAGGTPVTTTPPVTTPGTTPINTPPSGTPSNINVQALVDAVPASIRRANPDVAQHIERIAQAAERGGLSNAQTAYVMASAMHESGLGVYMEEFASGRAYENRADLGNNQPGDGVRFKGRGYVQLTGRDNYADWSNRLGVDLVGNPSLAEDPDIAVEILVTGMMEGTFTGAGLSRYVNDTRTDFVNARRVVNGTDRASLIAGYAENFQRALDQAPAATTELTPTTTESTTTSSVTIGAEGSTSDIWAKSTAQIDQLSPQMTATLDDIVAVWDNNGGPTPVITSGNDGRHSSGSLHYHNQALDLRTNNISDALSQRIADDLQSRLGSDYDVIFERFPSNPANDHIHVEFDPR